MEKGSLAPVGARPTAKPPRSGRTCRRGRARDRGAPTLGRSSGASQWSAIASVITAGVDTGCERDVAARVALDLGELADHQRGEVALAEVGGLRRPGRRGEAQAIRRRCARPCRRRCRASGSRCRRSFLAMVCQRALRSASKKKRASLRRARMTRSLPMRIFAGERGVHDGEVFGRSGRGGAHAEVALVVGDLEDRPLGRG